MLNNFNKPNKHCSRITSAVAFSLLVLTFSFILSTDSSASDEVNFPGKVTRSHSSGASDGHYVLYPEDKESVKRAINLLRDSKSEISTFSKMSVTKDTKYDGITKAVINLKHLSKVKGDKESKTVTAQAGATIDQLFTELIEMELVLPLADNSLMNIASNVLDEKTKNPSSLMCSMGPLSNYVQKIKAVQLEDGTDVEFTGKSAVNGYKESKAVITDIIFKAQPIENLHMLNIFFPYKDKERFCTIVKSLSDSGLFTEDSELFNPKLDFMLDTFRGPFEIPIMRINAVLYSSEENQTAKLESLQTCIEGILDQEKSFLKTDKYHGVEALRAIADTQEVFQVSPDLVTHSEWFDKKIVTEGRLKDYATEVGEKVFNVRKEGQERQFMSARLRITPSGLNVRGYNYTPVMEKEPLKEFRYTIPFEIGPKASSDLFRLTVRAEPIISNFSGPIYQENDGKDYQDRIIQYATSSFAKSSMSPFMVAYPKTVEDIQLALKYAAKHEKKVVARSGGHHYTGKSSGAQDTIVLSMDNFDTLKQRGGGLVEVGPGVRLTHLARQFKKWGMTIPHGECPFVAIGGHAQTGGYGHLVRSFGLALDYVESFDIVLADGTLLTAHRTDPEESRGKKIFHAVLGGNPGSFGIVTKYIINGIKDSEHPNSYGFSLRRSYNGETFKELMKEVQAWTKDIEKGTDNQSFKGLDFTMTVRSSASLYVLPTPALMLVELVYSDPDNIPYSGQFDSIISKAKQDWKALDYIPGLSTEDKGKRALSKLSDSFVRRFPSTTRKGREFDYPYKKRVNVTIKELSDDFVKDFCGIIDHVVSKESKDVKLIFQMVLGGGEHRDIEKRKDTSLPHRDFVYKFVFDLFYTPGNEKKAEKLQSKMQKIVDDSFHNDSHERRVFWGTFGDVDISKPGVREMYYDCECDYRELQKLKKEIDPNDLFCTSLTVKPEAE